MAGWGLVAHDIGVVYITQKPRIIFNVNLSTGKGHCWMEAASPLSIAIALGTPGVVLCCVAPCSWD